MDTTAGDITAETGDGTVRAVLGQIGTSANPDHGLKVISPDGVTTIIDGTSDIFAIYGTGTLTTSGSGVGKALANALLTTGQIAIPTALIWSEFLDTVFNKSAGEQVPNFVLNGVQVAYLYEGWAELTVTVGQVRVVVQTTATSAGSGGLNGVYRYFLMKQIAF